MKTKENQDMRQLKKENKTVILKSNERGITLIALVITIIVLLILSAVTIATLTGENGILTRATEASDKTKEANAKEQVQVEVLGSYGTDGQIDPSTLNNNLKNIEGITREDGTTLDANPITRLPVTVVVEGQEITITKDGSVTDVPGKYFEETEKVIIGGEEVYIPGGATVSKIEGEYDVSEGLVIYMTKGEVADEEWEEPETMQKTYDQFVWVPVNFSEFTREHFGTTSQKWWRGTFVTTGSSANNLYEPVADGIANSTEVEKMYKSVKEKGGFYVGRYEAGTTESSGTGKRGEVIVRKATNVYNNIGWANSNDTANESGGAVEVARDFATTKGYGKVTSTLIYGVQWDAIMRWMKDIKNENVEEKPLYVQNSTGMGWYSNSSGNSTHQTGIDLEGGKNKVKNIYDLAGNLSEWTMESYDTVSRVRRGGVYDNRGSNSPASSRDYVELPSFFNSYIGFRVTLYL